MAKLSENENWVEDLTQIETTDPVVGGPEGISNRHAKELGARTQFLKKEVELRATIVAMDLAIAAAVESILSSTPETLDTLNELAAALGDDPNFAATTAALIGTKLDATSYTATDILTKLRSVDGAGSGLDAEFLTGKKVTEFNRLVMTSAAGGTDPENTSDTWAKLATFTTSASWTASILKFNLNLYSTNQPSSLEFAVAWRYGQITDAPTELIASILSMSGNELDDDCLKVIVNGDPNTIELWFRKSAPHQEVNLYEITSGHHPDYFSATYHQGATWTNIEPIGTVLSVSSDGLKYGQKKIWHEGNQGSNSGLDADLLDGKHATEFVTSISPVFTGVPQAPTPAPGNNSQQIATTEFTTSAIAALVASSPGTLDTLNELAAALGDDPNFATSMSALIGTKLDASAFTGAAILSLLLPVDGAGSGLDADKLDGVQGSSYARKASPSFTGTPTAPTPLQSNSSTRLATTAFVKEEISALGETIISNTATTFTIQHANGLVEMGGEVTVAADGGVDVTFPVTLSTVFRTTAVHINSVTDIYPDYAAHTRNVTGTGLRVANAQNSYPSTINWSVLGVI